MTDPATRCLAAFEQITRIVRTSKTLLMQDPHEELIQPNVNFFTKSYLIMICVYLESYAKEIAISKIKTINEKLAKVNLPHNLLMWSLNPNNVRNIQPYFKDFEITLDPGDVDKYVSANPHRITELFRHLGYDLDSDKKLFAFKSILYPIVTKRNNIVHYNDSASDITFDDILAYIQQFTAYVKEIDSFIESSSPQSIPSHPKMTAP